MKAGRLRRLRRKVTDWIRSCLPSGKPTRPAKYLASAYLHGSGLEIGALMDPLRVPPGTRVSYVDRFAIADLIVQYPELKSKPLVPVDIICDGEKLDGVSDQSQDFVIARHFLEHCQDPIGTLKQFFRVLKPEGVIYLSVPDKRYTFDQCRQVTSLAHLLDDHRLGPERNRRAHFEEYAHAVYHPATEEELQQRTDELLRLDYSIHYHVWTQHEFLELLTALQPEIGFEIESFCKNNREIVCVLRKHVEENTSATPTPLFARAA